MVSWNEKCIVRFREFEYDAKDVEQAWYSEDEIHCFKEERKQIKKLVKRFASLEVYERTLGNLHSCRGLEKYISHTKAAHRKEQIELAFHLVHTAQASLRENQNRSKNADELISQAYQKVTKNCEKEALARGLLYMAWNNDNAAEDNRSSSKNERTKNEPVRTNTCLSSSPLHSTTIPTSIMPFEQRKGMSPPTMNEEANISLLVSFLSFSKGLAKTRS